MLILTFNADADIAASAVMLELVLHRRGKQPVKWPLRYDLDSPTQVASDAD